MTRCGACSYCRCAAAAATAGAAPLLQVLLPQLLVLPLLLLLPWLQLLPAAPARLLRPSVHPQLHPCCEHMSMTSYRLHQWI